MADTLQERITNALIRIRNARTGEHVLADETVRDIATTVSGRVRATVALARDDDPRLVERVRAAIAAVEGVLDVTVTTTDRAASGAPPPMGGAPPTPATKPAGRALPVMDTRAAAPRPHAPTPSAFPNLGKIVAVSSGKGGVGKSTVAVNVAVALARGGARVGLMDADVYGPNVPRMMGVNAPPAVVREQIIPLEAHGVKVMSLGFLIERDQPAIWRGPIIMKIIGQFLKDVAWGELDYFLVDMPPGTGDAQLSLVQSTNLTGALIVTTPQEMSVGDALRGVKMFQRVEVPVLGIIENMSWFECPHCGKPSTLFGTGGGDRLAAEVGLPLLGQIPLAPRVLEAGDRGTPIVIADPESTAARALVGVAEKVVEALAARP
ncbi:MAG TPA: Mrp/NBP35 family ATP-binding protein [Gemmatimonadaceae bacterium]|nr:Mrp/NBP35 family ATP-binding protein [Gemmatimonadaceae bacterium]